MAIATTVLQTPPTVAEVAYVPGSNGELLAVNNLGDVADADDARANIGAEALGVDNSTPVTLAGQTYLSLAGQALTAAAVNLATGHTTGTLTIAKGGTGSTAADDARAAFEIYAGVTLVSFTSGTGTLTYGVTAAAGTKALVTSIQAANTTEYVVRPNGTPGTTTAALVCHAAGSLVTASLNVHWVLIVAS